uniref:Putative secreted protein n=1 Tax=Rhipicephalus microplus TaxID=6941 RepID=A0A6G5A285_RHIMP
MLRGTLCIRVMAFLEPLVNSLSSTIQVLACEVPTTPLSMIMRTNGVPAAHFKSHYVHLVDAAADDDEVLHQHPS